MRPAESKYVDKNRKLIRLVQTKNMQLKTCDTPRGGEEEEEVEEEEEGSAAHASVYERERERTEGGREGVSSEPAHSTDSHRQTELSL